MSKILKSVTLGDVKNGGIFRALGKEFVKLDADEHGCLVLAKEIWTRMPFREGDDPECPNDLRRSEINLSVCAFGAATSPRSEEHTSELQSR